MSRYDNYGNGLTELVINETDSILMKSKEFKEICNEAYGGIPYHQAMIDYIASVDTKPKDQPFVFKVPQGQTSLHYYKWNIHAKKKIPKRK